jgi:hypothetical protein
MINYFNHLQVLIVVSLTFLGCFWMSVVALPALVSEVDPEGTDYASLLFLPHGVRVISAWLFGWKSVLYLAPASYIAHYWRLGELSLSTPVFFMPIFGIVCVALVFELVARFGVDLRLKAGYVAPWKDILLVGAIGSVVNAFGANLIVQNSIDTMLFYLLGDVLGMIVLFLVLILVFRLARDLKS